MRIRHTRALLAPLAAAVPATAAGARSPSVCTAAGLRARVAAHHEAGEQDGHPVTSMPWDHDPANDSVTLRLDARAHGWVPAATAADPA